MLKRLQEFCPSPIGGGFVFLAVLMIYSLTPLAIASADDSIRPDSLTFPVDCSLSETCVIQNYVDRDPGPGIADFTCGPLTYNGHKGTDIRLIDDAAMHRGVNVIAAFSGTVAGVRNGMPDVRIGAPHAIDVTGRECGNRVAIRRSDGVTVNYCHLKRDSILVADGDEVTSGDIIAQVGLSGRTQFPHLHFSVSNPAGAILDPFDTRLQDATCRFRDRRDLWKRLTSQDYQPGGLVNAGFSDAIPDFSAVQAVTADQSDALDETAPALVVWANFSGVRRNDIIELRLIAPDGEIIVQSAHKMSRTRAQQFRASGRKRRGQAWLKGRYTAVTVLRRELDIISKQEHTLLID